MAGFSSHHSRSRDMAEYYDPAGSEIPAYAGQRPRYPGVGRFLRTDRGNAAHRRSGTSTGGALDTR